MYNYTLHPSGDYVVWNVRETRHGVEESDTALIYIRQTFTSAVDSAERRNLVYNFKSMLKRDCRGNVIAGVYFALKPIEQGQFCVFYQNEAKQQTDVKIPFKDIFNEVVLDAAAEEALRMCKLQADGSLKQLLRQVTYALNDTQFLQQLLDVNQRIVILAENN